MTEPFKSYKGFVFQERESKQVRAVHSEKGMAIECFETNSAEKNRQILLTLINRLLPEEAPAPKSQKKEKQHETREEIIVKAIYQDIDKRNLNLAPIPGDLFRNIVKPYIDREFLPRIRSMKEDEVLAMFESILKAPHHHNYDYPSFLVEILGREIQGWGFDAIDELYAPPSEIES